MYKALLLSMLCSKMIMSIFASPTTPLLCLPPPYTCFLHVTINSKLSMLPPLPSLTIMHIYLEKIVISYGVSSVCMQCNVY